MNRSQLRTMLAGIDLSRRPDEQSFRRQMVELLDGPSGCFERTDFPAHFTGSALVLDARKKTKVLLHHHRKLDRWLQFGGHCDGDEDVLRVARREALEESGIEELEPLSQEPFDLDIHQIPAHGNEPAHWHYDLRYLLIAPAGALGTASEESHELRWFAPEDLPAQNLDAGMLRMILKWGNLEHDS